MRFVSKTWRPFDNEPDISEEDKKFAEAAAAKGYIPQKTANTLVAEEKRRVTKQLEDLQANFKGTKQEKEALAAQVEQLKSQYQTAEEKAKDEYTKKVNGLTAELDTTTKTSQMWRNNYSGLLMNNDLLRAAAKFEAFNPDIIVDLMRSRGEIVETINEDGTPSGRYEAKFRVSKKGKDGRSVDLTVTAEDAVKFMTEQPETYGSLFKNNKAGGTGGNNTNGSNGHGKSLEQLAASGVSGEALMAAYKTERKLN